MAPELAYIHRFEPGVDPTLPPVLLLHGTGGDETDLVPLGREIAPGAALLSPRGNVLEGNMPRFFRRFREGLFDEDDVRRRAGELASFVAEVRRAYGLDQPLALGYSNGANIAAAVLLLYPKTLAGAILLRAMAPLGEPPRPDLSGVPVLILSGLNDPIAPRSSAEKLAAALAAAGARRTRRPALRPWADPGRPDKGQGVLRARSGAPVPRRGMRNGDGDPVGATASSRRTRQSQS